MHSLDKSSDRLIGEAQQQTADRKAAKLDIEKANTGLQENKERLQHVVEDMPVLMDAFDAEGNILLWNKECERVTGFSADEIVGNPKSMELLYPDADYRRRMLAEWIERGDDYRDWEWDMACKDGSIKVVAWSNISRRFPVQGWATWGIGVDVTDRKKTEKALKGEQKLLRDLLQVHDRYRQLVSYEIHDGIVQLITGALIELQSAVPNEGASSDNAGNVAVRKAIQLLRDSITDARRLISGLGPPILSELGVIHAITHLVHELETQHDVKIAFAHNLQVGRLAKPLETVVFRIVQECLTNVVKHSGSHRVRISLAQQGERLQVEVQDWGIGFQPDQVGKKGFGLRGIRERARLFGGNAAIRSSPQEGANIVVELPLTEDAPD